MRVTEQTKGMWQMCSTGWTNGTGWTRVVEQTSSTGDASTTEHHSMSVSLGTLDLHRSSPRAHQGRQHFTLFDQLGSAGGMKG